jgi:arylsulfatase A-like enzyme
MNVNELPASEHSAETGKATRRDFLQGALAVAGTLATTGVASAPASAQAKPKRPNIVYFLGEGQRADALSLAGHPILRTPNHDRIGTEGMRFNNAFCTNALCAPARAAALTGMYSRSTGALSNENLRTPLPSDIPLFTDLLKQAGYEIAILGKVHMHNGVEERHWDYYFGHNDPGNNYESPLFKEGRNGTVGPQLQYHNVYPDDLTTDKALQWIDRDRGDKPFCILIWFVAPHEPFFRPRRHLDLYNGVPIPKPLTFDDDLQGYPGKPKSFVAAENKIGTTNSHVACGSLEGIAKDYYAGLVAVDENIGRVLDSLEQKGILDDTAILHTSDHGYFLGEWRLFDKRLMHEPSLRVPMMVRYPKRIKPGTVRDEMVLDIDIAPTLLDIAGVPTPSHVQGKSILPLATKANPGFRTEWYYEYYEWPNPEKVAPHRGIRTERYKLIQYVMDPTEGELYDLQTDPGERVNLYNKPEASFVQAQLSKRLEALRSSVPERQKI